MVMVAEYELIDLQSAPIQSFQLSLMPAAEKLVLKKKLRTGLSLVKSAIGNIEANFERTSKQENPAALEDHVVNLENCSSANVDGRQLCSARESHQTSMSRKRKAAELNKQDVENISDNKQLLVTEKSEATSTVTGVFKGDVLGRMNNQKGKGQKMDMGTTRQCAMILKSLMTDHAGWVFNQPVDPVKLNIPDYFSIVSKPMDLGTIKHRLEKMLYSSTLQFAADVRLTFSNAMLYNPPGNDVHIMAKELNSIFNVRWKSMEEKWRMETSTGPLQSVTKKTRKRSSSPNQTIRKTSTSSAVIMRKSTEGSSRNSCKGSDGHRARHEFLRNKGLTSLSTCMNGACGSLNCSCSCNCDITQASSSDVDSKRSSRRESHAHRPIASAQDCKKSLAVMDRNNFKSVSDSQQEAAVIGEDNLQTSSTPFPDASVLKGKDDSSCIEQLSPTKALRAVILKSRFADTILKARQKTLLNHGANVDPVKLQRERERLEKEQQEEKARIEAQVRAAEAAARVKAEAELKMQREREREEARLALQKMEKTVNIDENSELLKELEMLGYHQPTHLLDMSDETVVNFVDGIELQPGLENPLQKLGLFMKDEGLDDEAEEWISAAGNGDVEEGEINCS